MKFLNIMPKTSEFHTFNGYIYPMHKFPSIFSFLLMLLAIYWAFRSETPHYTEDIDAEIALFSTDRAFAHIEELGKQPHGVGFPGHEQAGAYIMAELKAMGLEVSVQEGYTAGDWANYSRATNILARIKGADPSGKALMLLSHYDSSPHSSLGASDAASGVATILEGIRAYLATQPTPKNDIIILISDAEELGLNGADLFVNQHPWAKEIGLVLNFEARGSGGPSIMLVETNRGNGKLIEEFVKAKPDYPVGNSLAYSIYKMLPNDTDLTIFREDGDIEGFNFAFIDDHYDYHTAKDIPERLDRTTLAHQGSYLMPLLHYFSNSDLTELKSLNDSIYFNVPFFKLVSYPFEWIWPMFGLSVLIFLILLVYGFRKKSLTAKGVALGFVPMLLVMVINGLIGYYIWGILKSIYPQYQDMLHGFTYNGYSYILAFTLLSVGICFWVYHKFKTLSNADSLVAPIVLWATLCGVLGEVLPGASFLILPFFGLLGSFLVSINQKNPSSYLLVFLALPALWILSPFVKLFPVGLGLKMLIAATLLSTFIFLLILPIVGRYAKKNRWAFISVLLSVFCLIFAHTKSGFSEERAKPNSLLYVFNADTQTAQWATYDHVLTKWNQPYFEEEKQEKNAAKTISSKYGTGFTFVSKAPHKNISPPTIQKTKDTIVNGERVLDIYIEHQRNVNRLELYTDEVSISKATINGTSLTSYYLKQRKSGKLVTHYITDNEPTHLSLVMPINTSFTLTLYEASNDLLNHSEFSVTPRPSDAIPMPFVLNDAILITKTMKF